MRKIIRWKSKEVVAVVGGGGGGVEGPEYMTLQIEI